VQALACAAIVYFWIKVDDPIFAVLTLISLIWATNLFNFMDGADGIAAMTAMLGGFALAAFSAYADYSYTLPPLSFLTCAAFIIAVAASVFLAFNLPPARMFMGDGGSTVLGLGLAAISVKGVFDKTWALAVPLAIFTPFWADATYTLVRRVLRGHNPTQPHREHLYQRLALAGLGHRGLLLWITGWTLMSIVVAALLRGSEPVGGLALVALYAASYLLFTEWTLRKQPNLLMNPRALLALVYDLIAAASAWALLFWARFNFNFDSASFAAQDVFRSLAFVVPVHAAVFVALGLYQGLWRFASMTDLRQIVMGTFIATGCTAVLFGIIRPDSFIVPRSVLLLQPALLILLMGGARFAYRSWKEHRLYGLAAAKGDPVLILGAGAAGARLVSELSKSETWHVVALLDDDHNKVGARVHNTLVAGKLDRTKQVAVRFGARHAIIAMPSANHEARKRAVEIATSAGLIALTVPSYDELLTEDAPLAKLRAIELEDLLGRDPVTLNSAGLDAWLSGRKVLVTGAGGSIGTELCIQIARFHPGRLVMVDISEFASHNVGELMATKLASSQLEVYVGDARNVDRMREIFERERPNVVFHAAAYKHVPLTESVNAWEAVRNNVLGTLVAAQSARDVAAEKFVLVSTDKAVRASSIMGASKRLAELAIMALPEQPTRFVSVRFGNVLGSNGSVIPKFRAQIAAGGPVTVTHSEMTRYFMSIPEAAQLVLQAGLIGEARSLYVLDMGKPVRIVELAEELIRLAKGNASVIPIVFTGLRPGEKMHEELTGSGERFIETDHIKVRRVISDSSAVINLDDLAQWIHQPTPQDVRAELKRWIVDFNPPDARAIGSTAPTSATTD
jgi:FlaA1/EpsC-like NDP-sugar epimerase